MSNEDLLMVSTPALFNEQEREEDFMTKTMNSKDTATQRSNHFSDQKTSVFKDHPTASVVVKKSRMVNEEYQDNRNNVHTLLHSKERDPRLKNYPFEE